MTGYKEMAKQLRKRLDDLLERTEVIEDDLRHPLDADSSEQAIDLADDEALEGIENVLRAEMQQIRLERIGNGSYETCAERGEEIRGERLQARPIATHCVDCA